MGSLKSVAADISRVPFGGWPVPPFRFKGSAITRIPEYLRPTYPGRHLSPFGYNNSSNDAVHCPAVMRPTVRLLANVKPGRFLEAGTPTGLTGLFTHDAPRSTLMYIYSSTLDKLQALPETSVYRQSAESLTKHRLKIVESIKPAKYEQWAEKAKATIAANPEVFNTPEGGVDHEGGSFGKHVKSVKHGRTFVTTTNRLEPDEREEEWDGETVGAAKLEGPRSTAERTDLKDIGRMRPGSDQKTVMWETEPPLEASQ